MTAPQEPLKLTLEEALCLLYNTDVGWLLVAVPARGRTTAHSWELHDADDEWRSEHATWHEAVGVALGRKVVARDDAAELRALLREAVEEIQAAVEAEYPLELRQRYRHISRRYLRDMELPDRIRAALAATEGSE